MNDVIIKKIKNGFIKHTHKQGKDGFPVCEEEYSKAPPVVADKDFQKADNSPIRIKMVSKGMKK